ncbi:hypothetical protein BJY01DRAFT_254647 [Aspergillus pseudoustus]|uniref:Uncharacterized protein n=1 Tax=Aspergillus pseudoustus TaxID=1810923 RepID=A0ABR4IRJ0_9EURO
MGTAKVTTNVSVDSSDNDVSLEVDIPRHLPDDILLRSRENTRIPNIPMVAGYLFWGSFLSRRFFGARTTAEVTWSFFTSLMLGLFCWQFANEHLYEKTSPTFDWILPSFARVLVVNLLFAMMDESHYVSSYTGCSVASTRTQKRSTWLSG